ncbi:MAG: ureidoglycolate lyase [Polyangiaceae bacterium]
MIARVEIAARPLTQTNYARYGNVLSAARHDVAAAPANLGTAEKRAHLAPLVNARPHAEANVSVFRCAPITERPVKLRLLEKHPLSTQMFVPMNARRYLVVVAEGLDAPDLSTLSAFVAQEAQAITYHPGIWHHPMIALDDVIDFVCVVFDDGTADDCVEADGVALLDLVIEV